MGNTPAFTTTPGRLGPLLGMEQRRASQLRFFAMRRICFTVVGAYLAVALLGHALERSGVAACDCRRTVGASAPA